MTRFLSGAVLALALCSACVLPATAAMPHNPAHRPHPGRPARAMQTRLAPPTPARVTPARVTPARVTPAPAHVRRSLMTDAVARRPMPFAHSALLGPHRTVSASHHVPASPMG